MRDSRGSSRSKTAARLRPRTAPRRRAVSKRNQAKARGGVKKEDNNDTGDKDGKKRQNQAKAKDGAKKTGYQDDEGRVWQVPGRGDRDITVQDEGAGLDDLVQGEGVGLDGMEQGEGAGRQKQGRGSEGTDSKGEGAGRHELNRARGAGRLLLPTSQTQAG